MASLRYLWKLLGLKYTLDELKQEIWSADLKLSYMPLYSWIRYIKIKKQRCILLVMSNTKQKLLLHKFYKLNGKFELSS